MLITGAMMTWYKSNTAAILLQWVNQTFNATANYTNRNASSPVTNEMLGQAYVLATLCSVSVAVGLNKAIARSATLSKGIIGRFVPLTAIAAANCINIPLMRQVELKEGIMVETADGVEVGKSKAAAISGVSQVRPHLRGFVCPALSQLIRLVISAYPKSIPRALPRRFDSADMKTWAHVLARLLLVAHSVAIRRYVASTLLLTHRHAQVVPSRILMAIPNMGFTPVIMAVLEKRGLFAAYPLLNMPITTFVTGS